jgi:hypothetical protein
MNLKNLCNSKMSLNFLSTFLLQVHDVENFMKRIKNSILNGDKEWIANHISYPLKIHNNNTETLIIQDKKQLIDNFDHIFHSEFVTIR